MNTLYNLPVIKKNVGSLSLFEALVALFQRQNTVLGKALRGVKVWKQQLHAQLQSITILKRHSPGRRFDMS